MGVRRHPSSVGRDRAGKAHASLVFSAVLAVLMALAFLRPEHVVWLLLLLAARRLLLLLLLLLLVGGRRCCFWAGEAPAKSGVVHDRTLARMARRRVALHGGVDGLRCAETHVLF